MFELAHVGIVVSNTDISIAFYCKLLGCTFIDDFQNDYVKLSYLKSGNKTIELLEYKKPETRTIPGNIDHLAFVVKDIELATERLKNANVPILFTTPKIVNNQKINFFFGPDGERLEIIQEYNCQQ